MKHSSQILLNLKLNLGCKHDSHCKSSIGYHKSSPLNNACDLVSQTCVSEICQIDVANGYIDGDSNNVGDNTTLICLPGFVNSVDNASRIKVSWYECRDVKIIYGFIYFRRRI